jgi:anthranilate phosphoribosyltransferase
MSVVDAIALAAAGDEVPAATLERAFDEIARGEASPVRIAALLVALRTKGETPPVRKIRMIRQAALVLGRSPGLAWLRCV